MIEVNWAEKYQESEAENQQLHRQRGEMYAEKLRLEERVLVKNSSINTLRRQRGELEAENDAWAEKWRAERAENERLRDLLRRRLEATPPQIDDVNDECWKYFEELEAELERLREAQQWIPVDEQIPEDEDEPVLLKMSWVDNSHQETYFWVNDWVTANTRKSCVPTHWRHIEPKESDDE